RLFMETNDPEEYRFATEHLGGWSHWKALKKCSWFKPYYEAWKEELEVRQRSQAIANIMVAADKPGRDGVEASKYIAEKKWEKKVTAGKGRPSNEKIKAEAELLYEQSKQAGADL